MILILACLATPIGADHASASTRNHTKTHTTAQQNHAEPQFSLPGSLLLVGGGAEEDATETGEPSWSQEPYLWFVDQAQSGKILVLSRDDLSPWLPSYFESLGAEEALVMSIESHSQEAIAAALQAADGVFLKGGNQQDYLDAWLNTPVEQEIRALFERGGAVGGTSAGAMVLGEFVSANALSRGPTSEENLLDPENVYNAIQSGFVGLLPGTVVDTHYIERGRPGRLLGMMGRILRESDHGVGGAGRDWNRMGDEESTLFGLGIDDQTAVMISPDGRMRVSGTGLVHWFRGGALADLQPADSYLAHERDWGHEDWGREDTRHEGSRDAEGRLADTLHRDSRHRGANRYGSGPLSLFQWPFHQLTHGYEIDLNTGAVLHQPETAEPLTGAIGEGCPTQLHFASTLFHESRLEELHASDHPDAAWVYLFDDEGAQPTVPDGRTWISVPYEAGMLSDTTYVTSLLQGERLFLDLKEASMALSALEFGGASLFSEVVRCSALALELPFDALPYFALGSAVNLMQDPYVAYDGLMQSQAGNGLAGPVTFVPDSYADADFLENTHAAPGWLTGELDASLAVQLGGVDSGVGNGLGNGLGGGLGNGLGGGLGGGLTSLTIHNGEIWFGGMEPAGDANGGGRSGNDSRTDAKRLFKNGGRTNTESQAGNGIQAEGEDPQAANQVRNSLITPAVLYQPLPGSTTAQSPFSPSSETDLPRNIAAISSGLVSVIPAGESYRFMPPNASSQLEQSFEPGWNLISPPLLRSHSHASDLFPGILPNTLYRFDGTYLPAEHTVPGEGYWAMFEDATTIGFDGVPSPERLLEVSEGWNLIGGLHVPSRVLDPEQIVTGVTAFGFDGSYVAIDLKADVLMPGRGYWVYASESGTIRVRTLHSPENAVR